jgi:hypothetical protein
MHAVFAGVPVLTNPPIRIPEWRKETIFRRKRHYICLMAAKNSFGGDREISLRSHVEGVLPIT